MAYKFLKLLSKNQKKRFPFLIILFGLSSVLEVITLASFIPFLNSISAPELIKDNNIILFLTNFFKVETDIGIVKLLGLVSFSLFVFSAIFRTIILYITNKFIESIRHHLCTQIFNDHLNKKYEEASDLNTYELSKVMLSEVDQVITNIVRPIFNLSSHIFLVTGITGLLLISNYVIALTSISTFLVVYFLVFRIARNKLNKLGKTRSDSNEKRFNTVIESLNGLKEIKMFNAIEITTKNFLRNSKDFSMAQAVAATLSVVPNYIIEAIAFGGIILITIFNLNIESLAGPSLGESFSTLGLFAISFYRIKPSAQSIYQAFSNFKFGDKALDNVLNKVLHLNQKKLYIPLKFKKRLSFKNVSFSYTSDGDVVIDDLNFDIKKGEKVFISGASGSGKSTILEIICGLRMPSKGSYLIDDTHINNDNCLSLPDLIGYVPQDTFLLNRAIKENIAFGENFKEIDNDKVVNAAEIVGMASIINNLPNSYNAIIGERGKTFSGGQKQRIGIARALYKNPEIIIFDEATSALDIKTEEQVLKNIINNFKDKTLIVVSHNSHFKSLFDKVIYIQK